MGVDRSSAAADEEIEAATDHGTACGSQRHALHPDDRLPMAPIAQGVSAVFDGAAVLLPLARRGAAADNQSCSGDTGARGERSRSKPQRRGIDSQSVKTTEAGGPRGYDAGKKLKGRKRHLLTDTTGLPLAAVVHQADIQDRDGAPRVLAGARYLYPWLRHVFADGGYSGVKLATALDQIGRWRSRSSSVATR